MAIPWPSPITFARRRKGSRVLLRDLLAAEKVLRERMRATNLHVKAFLVFLYQPTQLQSCIVAAKIRAECQHSTRSRAIAGQPRVITTTKYHELPTWS